jgi:predicted nucleic acid-binding protein
MEDWNAMRLLLDTNIFLEVLLEQEQADEARSILSKADGHELFASDYTLHSIGTLLFRRNDHDAFRRFLEDVIVNVGVRVVALSAREMGRVIQAAQKLGLDFDDAYQYTAAEQYGLTIVSFDADFDRTDRGRRTPDEVAP